jgi:hypothetical protein
LAIGTDHGVRGGLAVDEDVTSDGSNGLPLDNRYTAARNDRKNQNQYQV